MRGASCGPVCKIVRRSTSLAPKADACVRVFARLTGWVAWRACTILALCRLMNIPPLSFEDEQCVTTGYWARSPSTRRGGEFCVPPGGEGRVLWKSLCGRRRSACYDALKEGWKNRRQATFTARDLAMFVHRHSEGKDQFDRVMAAVRASQEQVAVGKGRRGRDRFTSRDMIET